MHVAASIVPMVQWENELGSISEYEGRADPFPPAHSLFKRGQPIPSSSIFCPSSLFHQPTMSSPTQTLTTATMSSFLKDQQAAFESTPLQDISQIVEKQRKFYDTGATRPLSFRKEQMRKLFYMLSDNTDELVAALKADLSKPLQESLGAEITAALQDIINVVKNIDEWAKDEYVPVNMAFKFNKCRIHKEPIGVVLVMGPWNFPLWCSITPALYAMAAGNTVIIKPSEHSPKTSSVLAKLITQTFDPEYLAAVMGGIPVAAALLAEKYDHIVYTGGHVGARAVALAAAKNLTPVTLELGGKNPCVVDCTAPKDKLEMYVNRIMWGKFCNAGQFCVGSDHVILVGTEQQENEFIALAKKAVSQMSAGGDMARIINDAHFGRLQGLLSATTGEIVHGGEANAKERTMDITIVRGVEPGDSLMGDEIFGPLLPILRTHSLDEAVKVIRQTDPPLALYVFSENRKFIDTVLDRCPSGGATINDTLMHVAVPNLPFGGIGLSGAGYYRSKYGYMRFSHLRSITETPTWGFIEKMMTGRYPPYTPEKMKKMEKLTGKPNPPFNRNEGSADRPQGIGGWIYAAGVAVIAGLAGSWYRSSQRTR